jgi:hypothetical protein
MATVVQRRRGTAAQHASFTGAQGEITIKTDTKELVVHDGSTPGGWTGGGFLQAGTGAVTRTAQAKMRDIVSVKDFGAVGDGVTDDTAAVQAFFNACQDGRGYMPPGIYKITSTLNLLPQYSYNIEGSVYKNTADAGTVILNTGTGDAIYINNEPFTPPPKDSQIRLSNMTIKGNSSSRDGIYTRQTMIHLDNVWLTTHGRHGLHLERAYSSSFKQVFFTGNAQNGCYIRIAGNALHFDHCLFNGNAKSDGYAGLYMTADVSVDSSNFGVVFTSCDFTSNGQHAGVTTAYGAVIQYSRPVSLVGCYFENNKLFNLFSDNTAQGLTVTGCYFQDASNSLTAIDGLVYENNFHFSSGPTTQLNIAGAMPGGRAPTRVFGNNYFGGATASMTAGASQNVQLWFTAPPSGGSWLRGDIVWNSLFQNGGGIPGWQCIDPGTPGTWLPLGQVPFVFQDHGDASATLTVGSSFTSNYWKTTLTANRTVTLSTTGAFSGARFRVTRPATGAFTLTVGGLKALSAGQWCDVEYDGAAWQLSAFGSL